MNTNKLISLAFVLIFLSAPAAWGDSNSLCSKEERVLFACSTGKKIVSVCASKKLTTASGYVQYRFGAKDRTPELVYPAEKVHPASRFSLGFTDGAKWTFCNLHFTVSGYSYTVYQYAAAFDEEDSGIRVKTPTGKSSYLRCKKNPPYFRLDALDHLGLRWLPEEALASSDSDGAWPADSPNTDLLQGVKTHDFKLVNKALDNGADVNFHSPSDVGVLGVLVDERWKAVRAKRVIEFDTETDRLLELLISHGASPKLSTTNGGSVIDTLANRAPTHTVQKLLDIGWPNDYRYRLYAGAILGNPMLVQEALNHGADPNEPIRDSRLLLSAIIRACSYFEDGERSEQEQAFAALELLLRAGAKIDEGSPGDRAGDIALVFSGFYDRPNTKPVLDLLVKYTSPTGRKNSLDWLKIGSAGYNQERQDISEWLMKRLAE